MIRIFIALSLIFVCACTSVIATESKPDDWDELKTSSNPSPSPSDIAVDLSNKFLEDSDYEMLEKNKVSSAKLKNIQPEDLEKLARLPDLQKIELTLQLESPITQIIPIAQIIKVKPFCYGDHLKRCTHCNPKDHDSDISFYLTHLSNLEISTLLPKFVKLDLPYCYIGARKQNIPNLASNLKNMTSLVALGLSKNNLYDEHISALQDVFQNLSQLQEVNLSDNIISDKGVNVLADALRGSQSLTSVDLSCNKISDEGATSLATLLDATALKEINLSNNFIRDKGVAVLAGVLKKSKSIISFNVCSNDFSAKGVKSLIDAAYNGALSLKTLAFYNTNTDDIAITDLDTLVDGFANDTSYFSSSGNSTNSYEISENEGLINNLREKRPYLTIIDKPSR